MDTRSPIGSRSSTVWLDADSASFEKFTEIVSTRTDHGEWPLATEISRNIPVYDGTMAREAASDRGARRALTAEWNAVFAHGPGIIVIKGAMEHTDVVDRATNVFEGLIRVEKEKGLGSGDHFAKPGANDRVWNAMEKHCLADPENFVRYYASDAIALASEAWLGHGYQVTSQVNRVNPGGTAQKPHRDYHLGFMTADQIARYPAQAHALSPSLTLQGAIAHCDMPIESGPTMLLPYSQRYFEGYLAFGRSEFQAFFAEHHVQLPLEKGDAVFFNPAVMHGAGTNRSKDIYRMANLLQVSSAFGRAIETVNRHRVSQSMYPALQDAQAGLSQTEIANVIAASAEGYAFPTNLDSDPPVGGLTPKTQADLVREALAAGDPPETLNMALAALSARREA